MSFHQEYIPSNSVALCCECGVLIEANSANMCINCIRSSVDITEGIPRQLAIYFCRGCERYLQPPAQWLTCELESKELLALILRRIKGLSKVRLVDASFLWTEPHSRRIKVKLTIQKEALSTTILQQSFVVEVVVGGQQCPECCRTEAKNTWNSVVQVRQKVDHKRTFLHLEQLILKHNAHQNVIGVKTMKDGLDFFFSNRSHALKLVDFLGAVAPIRHKTSEQLITQDQHSGDSTYKFTFSVEIVPVCKDDLVMLPVRVGRSLGGLGPLVLCTKVGTSVHLCDPETLQVAEMSQTAYWRDPFTSMATSRDLVEYIVIDVETGSQVGRYLQADVIVARASEFGRSTQTFNVRSHLGHILKPGDMVLGFDMISSNFNNSDFDEWVRKEAGQTPDVILVKKSFAHLRRQNRSRPWKLKELPNKQLDDSTLTKMEIEKAENDYEKFLQDLEEDQEMRSNINLYRDPNYKFEENNEMEEDEDLPRISLEELIEDLSLNDN